VIPIRARLAIVLIGGLMLQAAIVPLFAINGRVVDVLLLLAVVGGVLGDSERGVVIGFLAGLGTDLLVHTPFGMWALVGALVGYASGSVVAPFTQGGRFARFVSIAIALGIGTLTFVVLGRLIGQDFLADIALMPVLATVMIGGMVLTPAAVRAMAWGLGLDRLPWDLRR
jgi:rod shape-determining protein MreD